MNDNAKRDEREPERPADPPSDPPPPDEDETEGGVPKIPQIRRF